MQPAKSSCAWHLPPPIRSGGQYQTKGERVSRFVRVRKPVWLQLWHLCIVFLTFCRVGEATNPGPEFIIGAVNPTGLLHKVSQFNLLPHRSFWGVSESHITTPGLQQFRRELGLHKSKLKVYHSAPAPHLSNNLGSVGGKASGVGFLSTFPGHNMHHQWPKRLNREARTHVAFCIDGIWIRAGVAYGYAKRPNYCETRDRTDELLALLTERIVHQSQGPRVIMGDFNQEWGKLPQEKVWAQHGFVEIQQFAKARWNREIDVTCKGASTKDFVWISRELIPFLASIDIDHHMFADHSVVMAKFHSMGPSIPVNVWQKPAPLPWDKLTDPLSDYEPEGCDNASTDECVKNLFEQLEHQLHCTLRAEGKPGLMPIQKGRARANPVKRCCFGMCPQKASRQDEFQPSFVGENRTHALWLKQVRRIASLEKLLSGENCSSAKTEHSFGLWEAIRQAAGFPGGFNRFWQTQQHASDAPSVVPHSLPDLQVVSAIRTSFESIVTQLEKTLKANRHAAAKQTRIDDSSRIYKDVARPKAVPVQTLISSRVAQVTSVDENLQRATYPSGILEVAEPVSNQAGILKVITHTPGEIFLDGDQGVQEGDLLLQEISHANPNEVMQEFENLWMTYWGRHENTPCEKWEPFVELCQQCVAPRFPPMAYTPITARMWKQAVQSRKKAAAIGPDGISRLDLLNLPPKSLHKLLQILQRIEDGEPWPVAWMVGVIHALEKRSGAARVTSPSSVWHTGCGAAFEQGRSWCT